MLNIRIDPATATSMRDVLRDVTRELHDQVEAIWSIDGGFASLTTYRDFLGMILRVHQELGVPAAAARGVADNTSEELERIDALMLDLNLPRRDPPAPKRMDESYAWGVGYVLNGSSLGASMMMKDGSVQAGWPSRYMAMGQDYARSGKLRHYLNCLNTLPLDAERVAHGAVDTFAALKHREKVPA